MTVIYPIVAFAFQLSSALASSILLSELYFPNFLIRDSEVCIMGKTIDQERAEVILDSVVICCLGLAMINLSILLATILMAAESLLGHKSDEKRSFIIMNLVISSLMLLLIFPTLMYDSYGTVKSFNSILNKSKHTERIAAGCVFLMLLVSAFLARYVII